jgi:hypothetical protein
MPTESDPIPDAPTCYLMDWFNFRGYGDADAFAEASAIAANAETYFEAGDALREWFTARLTTDGSAAGRDGNLVPNLLSHVLGQVDWMTLAEMLPGREYGEGIDTVGA